MAKRSIKDPTAWRTTPVGIEAYNAIRSAAQADANRDGYDRGIEANDLFKSWRSFILPARKNRSGHELWCEVVTCEVWDRIAPGHGSK